MDSCTNLKGARIKTAKPSVHGNEQQVSVVQVKTTNGHKLSVVRLSKHSTLKKKRC